MGKENQSVKKQKSKDSYLCDIEQICLLRHRCIVKYQVSD